MSERPGAVRLLGQVARRPSSKAFLQGWERARALLSTQQGYLSTRLHRSLSPTAEFRFVNVARWPTRCRPHISTPSLGRALRLEALPGLGTPV